MVAKAAGRQYLDRFLYFFPFQLAILHLKRNHFLLLFWLILFGFTTQLFANKFGIPYLFLAPEYRGEVGIWSYAILGFSLGAFIMAFNIYSYIIHAKRFPFLATLSRPFIKFCVNNFIIPIVFVITYIYCSSQFLSNTELKSATEITMYMVAFLSGNILFITLALAYFFPTNKNIYKITGNTEEQMELLMDKKKARFSLRSGYQFSRGRSRWRVDTYLSNPLKLNLARESAHYDQDMLRQVFYQNHVNASLFEILIVLAFFFVGAFQFSEFFVIPAAASTFLVFTVVLMVISISMSWLKGWTLTVLIAIILLVDFASGQYDAFHRFNPAYGIDYDKPAIAYSAAVIDSLNGSLMRVSEDQNQHLRTLNLWLDGERKRKGDPAYKPKMIILNTSGGGLRSSLWTVRALQYCDSLMDGALSRNMRLMTGSSGGTIGAAYYRDLYMHRSDTARSLYSDSYQADIAKDILNRVLFTFATNDIFVRFRKRDIAGHSYVVDRAMTFEDQLNKNTHGVFDKPMQVYAQAESQAEIPMLILAPSVVNDGRRMLISSSPISYMCYQDPNVQGELNLAAENIEFSRMFVNHGAKDLLMSSALRMNSTFPYILPYASLPTEPPIEVMDAGLRDNFGMKITSQYLFSFRSWIEKNTSGIVILQIRDTEKDAYTKTQKSTILDKLTSPIGSFYGNYFNDQDYNMDQILQLTSEGMEVPIYQLPLEMRNNPGEHIALSWHLTELEKIKVVNSIEMPWNQKSVARLRELIDE